MSLPTVLNTSPAWRESADARRESSADSSRESIGVVLCDAAESPDSADADCPDTEVQNPALAPAAATR